MRERTRTRLRDKRKARFGIASTVLVTALTVAEPLFTSSPAETRASAASPTTRFEAGTPCRLADVRNSTGFERVDSKIVRVVVSGRCGVPAEATAVALTVTVDNLAYADSGYVTIWPEGAPIPTASIVNYRPRQVRANGAIVSIGVGGAVAKSPDRVVVRSAHVGRSDRRDRVHVRGSGT